MQIWTRQTNKGHLEKDTDMPSYESNKTSTVFKVSAAIVVDFLNLFMAILCKIYTNNARLSYRRY